MCVLRAHEVSGPCVWPLAPFSSPAERMHGVLLEDRPRLLQAPFRNYNRRSVGKDAWTSSHDDEVERVMNSGTRAFS